MKFSFIFLCGHKLQTFLGEKKKQTRRQHRKMWQDTETDNQDNERLEQILVKNLRKFNHEKWGKEGRNKVY